MTLWDLIKTGGWAMWPLGLCSVGLVAFVVLNFRQVNQKRLIPAAAVDTLQTAVAEGDAGKMADLCAATSRLFTNALQAGLRKLNPDDPVGSKPAVEAAIAEAVGREESQLGFWINFLSLITAISPMIGFLSTVSGMIGAFQKITGVVRAIAAAIPVARRRKRFAWPLRWDATPCSFFPMTRPISNRETFKPESRFPTTATRS